MYKCAIIGVSGGRARGLADAYRYITRVLWQQYLHGSGINWMHLEMRMVWLRVIRIIAKCLGESNLTWCM